MLNKKNQTIVKTVSYILLIIIAIYCVFPFIWMVISAFKPKDEIRTAIPSFVIHAPTLENFKKVLFQAGFINYIKNSFIVSVIACGLSMVIAVMAGYALSRYYKQKLVKVSNFAMMLSHLQQNIRPPKKSERALSKLEREKNIVNMYNEGHSIDDIFAISGFTSRSSVFRILNKHGVTLNRGPHSGPLKKRNKE